MADGQKVKIRFSNHLANVVIDQFGKAVRIPAPAEVVEETGNYVKGIAEMY